MDKINKALLKLPDKQRKKLLAAFGKVLAGELQGLNLKKLKGHGDIYRLRVGDTRLVYKTFTDGKPPIILSIGKRDDQTYRDF